MSETRPEVTVPDVNSLAELASSHLGIAERALQVAHMYTQDGPLHDQLFASSGLNLSDLRELSEYGVKQVQNCLGQEVYTITDNDRKPEELVSKYTPIDTSVVIDPTVVADRTRVIDSLRAVPEDNTEEIDSLFDECEALVGLSPSRRDLGVVVGLAVARLTQTLGRKDIHDALLASNIYPEFLRDISPFMQALYLIEACIGIDTVPGEGIGYLENCFDLTLADSEYLDDVKSSLSEARLITPLLRQSVEDGNLIAACGRIADVSISEAAEYSSDIVDLGIKATQSLGVDASEQEVIEALELESQVNDVTRKLARRARNIGVGIGNVYRLLAKERAPFDVTTLPVAKTPLHQTLHEYEATQTANRIEARRIEQLEAQRGKVQIIEDLRAKYFMSNKAVKKHPAGNSLTRMLITGSDPRQNYEAKPVGRDTVYALAGLMFTLTDQFEAVGRDKAFDDFFESVDAETRHTQELESSILGPSLEGLASWLMDNQQPLISSNIGVFRSIGVELRKYMALKKHSEQVTDDHQLVH